MRWGLHSKFPWLLSKVTEFDVTAFFFFLSINTLTSKNSFSFTTEPNDWGRGGEITIDLKPECI